MLSFDGCGLPALGPIRQIGIDAVANLLVINGGIDVSSQSAANGGYAREKLASWRYWSHSYAYRSSELHQFVMLHCV